MTLSLNTLYFKVCVQFYFFSFRSYLFSNMSARQCKTDPNRFCYICRKLTFAKEKHRITNQNENVQGVLPLLLRRPGYVLPYMHEDIECLV